MSYNGREVMEEVITKAGWTSLAFPHEGSTASEPVFYDGPENHRVLIFWTLDNTAIYVAINPGSEDEEICKGPGALIQARTYIEGNPQ